MIVIIGYAIAAMRVAPFLNSNVFVFSVEEVIASLNVAVTDAFRGMPVAEFAGTVDTTVGALPPGGPVGVSSLHAAKSSRADASQMVERFICDLLYCGYCVVARKLTANPAIVTSHPATHAPAAESKCQ